MAPRTHEQLIANRTRPMPAVVLVLIGANAGLEFEVAKYFARINEEGSRQLVYGAVGSLYNEDKPRGKYIQRSEVVDFVISKDGKIVQDEEEMFGILDKFDSKILNVAKAYLTKA
ncbi:hypothetical protein IW261DRAFT_1418353 [Armillaria novae-zelandiae]|uniref:Uncharacterized protein n=1 Tax=Armillaria novae-zelandiae TaxID=153914 RepID=A0AA39U9L4_9AGAR|nr:hypothetical protein IW261DRAFT_1418353 [Armillaria novae-zelandiae]